MFKKIFIGCICGMLLWNILSNATGGIVQFTMPEKTIYKDNISFDNSREKEITLNKVSLNCDFFPLNDYESEKGKIERKTNDIKSEFSQITKDIKNTIDDLK